MSNTPSPSPPTKLRVSLYDPTRDRFVPVDVLDSGSLLEGLRLPVPVPWPVQGRHHTKSRPGGESTPTSSTGHGSPLPPVLLDNAPGRGQAAVIGSGSDIDTPTSGGGDTASTTMKPPRTKTTLIKTTTEREKNPTVSTSPGFSRSRRVFVDIVRPSTRRKDSSIDFDEQDCWSDDGPGDGIGEESEDKRSSTAENTDPSMKDEELDEPEKFTLSASSSLSSSEGSLFGYNPGVEHGRGTIGADSSTPTSSSSSTNIRIPRGELSGLNHELVLSPPRHPAGRIPVPPIPFPISDITPLPSAVLRQHGTSGRMKPRPVSKVGPMTEEKTRTRENASTRKAGTQVVDLTLDGSDDDGRITNGTAKIGRGQRRSQREVENEVGNDERDSDIAMIMDESDPFGVTVNEGLPEYSAHPRPGIDSAPVGRPLALPVLGKRTRGSVTSPSVILLDDDDDDITLLSQSPISSSVSKIVAQGAMNNKNKRLKMDVYGTGLRREATSSSAGASTSTQTSGSFPTRPRAQNFSQPVQKIASTSSSFDHTVDETIKHLELTISRQQRELSQYKRELSVSNVLLVEYRKALRDLVSQVLNVSESVVLPSFESDDEDEQVFNEVTQLVKLETSG